MSQGMFDRVRARLRDHPRTWLVTGAAGFIGSHLVEELLSLRQRVIGLDNFSTGHRRNLDDVLSRAAPDLGRLFTLVEGDICDPRTCREAVRGADLVLHQAALGSVPRSMKDPASSHATNATGFLNVLVAAIEAKVSRFVYASSSSVYGNHPGLPKVEDAIGDPLSPYAATKRANEVYAAAFGQAFGIQTIGLRYFNVFGPRQDPEGPYAAVMPRWFASLLAGDTVRIYGDGETSRDFCYVANAVQANVLAAAAERPDAVGQVYNIAVGARTTLNELYRLIRAEVARYRPACTDVEPVHEAFRPGDVRHSLADVAKACERLGYAPTHTIARGLAEAAAWYARTCTPARGPQDSSP